MCGDATLSDDVNKLMDGKMAQMCFTDPPYNVDYTGGVDKTGKKHQRDVMQNDKMSDESFYNFLSETSKRIIENTIGGVYICMSAVQLGSLKNAWENNGGHWQSFIIWVKNNFTLSRSDYQHIYEPILYGWSTEIVNHYFNKSRDIPNVWEDLREVKTEFDGKYTSIKFHGFEVKIKGKPEGTIRRKKMMTDIWRHDKPIASPEHPTMKPIGLCSEAIKNSSRIDDIVIDYFLGSGSTLIAADKMNRICYGMELDPIFIDVVIKRWEILTGEKAKQI